MSAREIIDRLLCRILDADDGTVYCKWCNETLCSGDEAWPHDGNCIVPVARVWLEEHP